ncbi:hypothetical protein Scep_009944 [Stephania cephalantha]|uniref:Uncharacterized protein n=1 Tax=Stephania cephalantha TaxID=152367 RepID=A0AAP0JU34_9MAGN
MLKFEIGRQQLMDHMCNTFNISSTEIIVMMTYRQVIILPGGSQYFVPVLLQDTTHFDLMWATVANLPLTATVDIYLTFKPIDFFLNPTVHSQLVYEDVGTSDTRSMMERLHMQSPQGDVVQDGCVSPIHDDINACSDDDPNDDDDNDTDEDVRSPEDVAPSID